MQNILNKLIICDPKKRRKFFTFVTHIFNKKTIYVVVKLYQEIKMVKMMMINDALIEYFILCS
jgi:hypothetical protein